MKKFLHIGKLKLNTTVLAAGIVCIGVVAGTTALLSHITGTKENSFNYGIVNIKVDEDFPGGDIHDGKVKKEVKIANSSENGKLNVVPVYIRAQLVTNWEDKDGNVLAVDCDDLVDYGLMSHSNWVKGDDGYYYYTKIVDPDKETELLLDSVEAVKKDKLPEKGNCDVQVLADGIQTTGDAMKDAWGEPKSKGTKIQFQK